MDEFPKTYDVPRNGEVVAVSVCDRDEVRVVRTELELFRRIRRQLSMPEVAQVYPIPGKYGESDLQDLKSIACDAYYSSLDGLIDQIDRDFVGLREEIQMASVKEEAEVIAHEVAESGAAPAKEESTKVEAAASKEPALEPVPEATADPVPEAASAPAPEPAAAPVVSDDTDAGGEVDPGCDADSGGEGHPVHEALVEAEAELAKAVGIAPDSEPAAEVDSSIDDVSEPASSDEEKVEKEPDETCVGTDKATAAAEVCEVDAQPVEAQGSAPGATVEVSEEGVSEIPPEPEQVQSMADAKGEQPVDAPAPVDTADGCEPSPEQNASEAWSPDRAERAVGEIEAGIRKLAGVLTTEVNDQWKGAKSALEEIQSIRDQLGQANERSRVILDELNRMKEQVGISRSETDIARREARLFREDAKRAKERADRSADAAEKSAENASLELEHALTPQSQSPS